jgi:hypothetical protein
VTVLGWVAAWIRSREEASALIEIVFELAVLAFIAAGILYLVQQWGNQRRPAPGLPGAIEAPPEARWRAIHSGTADERTQVQIVLRGGQRDQVWDRRTCAVISNLDPDYDRLLFNALEDARSRAALLNGLRDE